MNDEPINYRKKKYGTVNVDPKKRENHSKKIMPHSNHYKPTFHPEIKVCQLPTCYSNIEHSVWSLPYVTMSSGTFQPVILVLNQVPYFFLSIPSARPLSKFRNGPSKTCTGQPAWGKKGKTPLSHC